MGARHAQMSDPFGNDDVDFDLEAFIRSAYDNAVALLLDERIPCEEVTPNDLDNPLVSAELRHWDDYGVALGTHDWGYVGRRCCSGLGRWHGW